MMQASMTVSVDWSAADASLFRVEIISDYNYLEVPPGATSH